MKNLTNLKEVKFGHDYIKGLKPTKNVILNTNLHSGEYDIPSKVRTEGDILAVVESKSNPCSKCSYIVFSEKNSKVYYVLYLNGNDNVFKLTGGGGFGIEKYGYKDLDKAIKDMEEYRK